MEVGSSWGAAAPQGLSAVADTGETIQVTDQGAQRGRLQWALEAYVRSTRALILDRGLGDVVENVCQAIVAGDRYLACAVGLASTGAGQEVRIIAAAGQAAGYLDGIVLSASADEAAGTGPTGLAMRSGEPWVLRDALNDPVFAPWRERARPYGIRSSVTVPFKLGGVVRGVLIVYAAELDSFGPREMGLFQELAEELAFAISVQDDRERLAEAARDYKLLADNVSDIILRYDRDRVVRYISPSVAQLGYAPEDIVGGRPFGVIHPDDVGVGLGLGGPPDQAGPEGVTRLRVRRADGEWRWLEGTPRIVRDAAGEPVEAVMALRDITERRNLEEELRRKQAEAEAGVQAKAEFLANMSHELRTPLTAILGFAEALRRSPTLPDADRAFAERVALAGEALHTIIDQILDFSQIDAGRLELDATPFDPAALLADCAQLLEAEAAAKGLDLGHDVVGALPALVTADAGRVRQVLLSLAGNALKFTEAGHVRLSASYDAEAGLLRFAVSDTGMGIPADQAERLFERFSQVDGSATRRHGGAGLGLALAKTLVERMGGEIGYASQEAEGSTFWFSAPAPAAAPPVEAALPEDAAPPRVLIVDDAPMNRELVAVMLEAAGYELDYAEDGAQAVEKAENQIYDLILMDMQMPVMDGPTAAQAIRARGGLNAETPIVAVSANVLPMHVQACLDAGMDDHIPKPIGSHSLITKATHWIGRTHQPHEGMGRGDPAPAFSSPGTP